MKRFLLLCIFSAVLFPVVESIAQTDDCELVLNRAAEELNAGHFLGIDSLLQPCFQSGFTREQRQRANLLMTQVYLLLDQPENAEQSYLELLRANPEFETDPSRDPIDVVYLSKKFTATPIFSILGQIGSNISFVNVIRSDNITGRPPISTNYSVLPGYNAALGADWNINDRVSLGTELQFSSSGYEREQVVTQTTTTVLRERMSNFTVPLFLKYAWVKKRYTPYVYAGASVSYLLSSRTDMNLVDKEFIDSETVTPSESPTMDNSFKRNKVNQSFLVGAGINYKSGLHYWFVDVRYSIGLSNLYNGAIFDYDQAIIADGYIDYTLPGFQNSADGTQIYESAEDFFKINNLFFSIGYKHQLYKPRKLKTARTKGLLRLIKRSDETKP